jgi:hypothetical protein
MPDIHTNCILGLNFSPKTTLNSVLVIYLMKNFPKKSIQYSISELIARKGFSFLETDSIGYQNIGQNLLIIITNR